MHSASSPSIIVQNTMEFHYDFTENLIYLKVDNRREENQASVWQWPKLRASRKVAMEYIIPKCPVQNTLIASKNDSSFGYAFRKKKLITDGGRSRTLTSECQSHLQPRWKSKKTTKDPVNSMVCVTDRNLQKPLRLRKALLCTCRWILFNKLTAAQTMTSRSCIKTKMLS